MQPKGISRSYASLLINEQKANPLIIKECLEYEDIQTTLGTYSYLYENVDLEVADGATGVIKFETATTSQVNFSGNQSVKKVDINQDTDGEDSRKVV